MKSLLGVIRAVAIFAIVILPLAGCHRTDNQLPSKPNDDLRGIKPNTNASVSCATSRTAENKQRIMVVQAKIDALRNSKWGVRQETFHALIKTNDTLLVDVLLACIEAPELDLKGEAIDKLGDIKDPRAVEPLIKCLEDDEVAWRAAKALGNLKDPRAVEPLIKCLEDDKVASHAAAALGNLKDIRAVVPLIECLKKPSVDVRRQASSALGKLGDTRAVEPLLDYLKKDGDADIIVALGELGDGRALAPMISALCKMEDHGYYNGFREAVCSLAKLGDPAVESLVACLDSNNTNTVRVCAASSLRIMGGLNLNNAKLRQIAVQPLIACLQDQSSGKTVEDVRIIAVDALKYINDARAVAPLLECWENQVHRRDENYDLIEHISKAIGKLGGPETMHIIVGHLNKSKSCKRGGGGLGCKYWAAQALVDFGPLAVEPLIGCLNCDDFIIRAHAAEALAELGDVRAVEPLIQSLELVGREDVSVVKALGKLADSRAVGALIRCLQSKNTEIRKSAAVALGGIGDSKAIDPLVATLPDWSCRKEIGAALAKLKWMPKTEDEKIYYWICESQDSKDFEPDWETVKRILLRDVRSSESKKRDNAVYALIAVGRNEIVPELIGAMNCGGSAEMAQTYLNCGQKDLRLAAEQWCKGNGYRISTSASGGGMTTWGSR